ncbi:MAG TPA: hypothetical protein VMY39_00125 [Planctomycetota bacterium]|nr:hypothetical protein [Planctomycetota bacterium]
MPGKPKRKRPKRSASGAAAAAPATTDTKTRDEVKDNPGPMSASAPAPPPVTVEATKTLTTAQFPCVCPGEKYPITRAVCIGRQERNYDKCLRCGFAQRERRPRRSDFREA